MSLINQMLKDLAERHPKDELSTNLLATHGYSTTEPRVNNFWLLYVGAPLTLLALVLIGVQQAQTTMEPLPSIQNDLPSEVPSKATTARTPERPVASMELVPAVATAPAAQPNIKSVTPKIVSNLAEPVVVAAPKPATEPAKISANTNAIKVPTREDAQPLFATVKAKPAATITDKPAAMPVTPTSEQLHRQALSYYHAGDYQQAEAHWQQATNLPNPSIEALMQYSLYLVRSGQTNRAADLLQPYRQNNLATTALLNLYSKVLIEQGDTRSAITQLQRQRSLGKFDIESTSMLAALLQKNSDHKNAAALYQEVVAGQPQAGLAWLGLGISREALRESSASYFAYQQALEQRDIAPHLREFILSRMQALQPNGRSHVTH